MVLHSTVMDYATIMIIRRHGGRFPLTPFGSFVPFPIVGACSTLSDYGFVSPSVSGTSFRYLSMLFSCLVSSIVWRIYMLLFLVHNSVGLTFNPYCLRRTTLWYEILTSLESKRLQYAVGSSVSQSIMRAAEFIPCCDYICSTTLCTSTIATWPIRACVDWKWVLIGAKLMPISVSTSQTSRLAYCCLICVLRELIAVNFHQPWWWKSPLRSISIIFCIENCLRALTNFIVWHC